MKIENINPVVISRDGQNLAPVTASDLVFNEDGTTVSDSINSILNMDYVPNLRQKSEVVNVTTNQAVIDIPFPYQGFDMQKSIMMVFDNDNKLIDRLDYTVTDNQIILSSLDKYSIESYVTFKFIYVQLKNTTGGGSGGGFGNIIKKTIKLTSTNKTVDLGLNINTDECEIMLYKNSVYVEKDEDYTFNQDGSITFINDNEVSPDTTLNVVIYT